MEMEVDEHEYAETGSGVMVSNLPLLFSRGSPSSLYEMYQSELEVFVPFMVRCSVGEERPVPWSHLPRPAWWPKKLPFRMPPTRNALVALVERCYAFHGCEYLLKFCGSLVAQMPPSGYRFNDNRDGTTSMYHGSTGKLLVTFRNENRDYDKFRHDGRGRDATKKLLLSPSSHGGGGGGGGSSGAMFQPPVTDIYLCDKCENEFYSLKEVQTHEKQCCGEAPVGSASPSPEPEPPEEEPEPAGQVPFLAYFNLRPAQHTGLEPYMSPRKKSVSSPPRKLPGPIYPRYDSIALTSPLGRYLFTNSKLRNKYQASQHSVMRYERHLHATPNTDVNYRERCTSRWIVVWRSRKEEQPWVHLYCFNRLQRRDRRITLRTGLDRNSRRLQRLCRPVSVKIKRLQKRLVDRLLRMGGPSSAPCIDLTEEQQQLEGGHFHPGQLDSRMGMWGGSVGQGQVSVELQWVPGLPQDHTSACAPGSSGTIPPHYTAQVGLRGLTGHSVDHQNSQNLLHYMPGGSQLQQPATSQWPHISNNSHMKHPPNFPGQGGFDIPPPPPPNLPLPSGISLIPLGAMQNPSRSQLEADFMKPRSRKKYGDLSLSQASWTGGQQVGAVHASPAPLQLPVVLPQPHGWDGAVPPANSTVTVPHTLTNSSIEIIDLSSDEDDYGRVRGRSEAANAPQQLDGLACYPHTGAKVPSEASEYSLSKNGNSHWSSQQKSHCGAGRGGDLATNGQPPNVLPSPASSFSTPYTSCPHTKGNSRKRKSEEDQSPQHGGKTIILDISTKGVMVSEDGLLSHSPVAVAPPKGNCASQNSISIPIDEDISFKTPLHVDEDVSFSVSPARTQEAGLLDPKGLPSSPLLHSKAGGSFLANLLSKGLELYRSLVGNNTKQVSPCSSGDSVTHRDTSSTKSATIQQATQGDVALRKKKKMKVELEKLLGDECRELKINGLGKLSHPNLLDVRLTRKSVERFLPNQPLRKTRSPRLKGTLPLTGKSVKTKVGEEGKSWGGVEDEGHHSPSVAKDHSVAGMDENGNSAVYIQPAPRQHALGGCLNHAARRQESVHVLQEPAKEWREVEGPPHPSLWNGHKMCSDETPASDRKVVECSDPVAKSTVLCGANPRNCKVLKTNSNSGWYSGATSNLESMQCRKDSVHNNSTSQSSGDKSKDALHSGHVTMSSAIDRARGSWQPVCSLLIPRNLPDSGEDGQMTTVKELKLTVSNGGGDTATCTESCSSLAGRSKCVPGSMFCLGNGVGCSQAQTPLARPELTGETAEECGALQALCPLPDQQHHYPARAGAPSCRPHVMLLKKASPPSGRRSTSPDENTSPHPNLPSKPPSTNKKRKRNHLNRELNSLGRDEWKELRGSGFHPSDFVGCEEVKYLCVSSDEDEGLTPSPFPSPSPSPSPSPTPSRLFSLFNCPPATTKQKDKKPPATLKVSREVALLLKDECKELRGRTGHLLKSHQKKVKERRTKVLNQLRGNHINAPAPTMERIAHPGRCSTRSQANTLTTVTEVLTPRDSHRHLLRSEVAMCVLNYKLPNIN